MSDGINPRDIKIDFAKEIVARFHTIARAETAHQEFTERFQKGAIPDNLEEVSVSLNEPMQLAQLLKHIALTQSTSEAIRLIKQAAVKIDGEKVINPAATIGVW